MMKQNGFRLVQRKFAQGVPIPSSSSSVAPQPQDRRPEPPCPPRNVYHNNMSARNLLDIVAMQNIHKHKEPMVLLERLRQDEIPPQPAPPKARVPLRKRRNGLRVNKNNMCLRSGKRKTPDAGKGPAKKRKKLSSESTDDMPLVYFSKPNPAKPLTQPKLNGTADKKERERRTTTPKRVEKPDVVARRGPNRSARTRLSSTDPSEDGSDFTFKEPSSTVRGFRMFKRKTVTNTVNTGRPLRKASLPKPDARRSGLRSAAGTRLVLRLRDKRLAAKKLPKPVSRKVAPKPTAKDAPSSQPISPSPQPGPSGLNGPPEPKYELETPPPSESGSSTASGFNFALHFNSRETTPVFSGIGDSLSRYALSCFEPGNSAYDTESPANANGLEDWCINPSDRLKSSESLTLETDTENNKNPEVKEEIIDYNEPVQQKRVPEIIDVTQGQSSEVSKEQASTSSQENPSNKSQEKCKEYPPISDIYSLRSRSESVDTLLLINNASQSQQKESEQTVPEEIREITGLEATGQDAPIEDNDSAQRQSQAENTDKTNQGTSDNNSAQKRSSERNNIDTKQKGKPKRNKEESLLDMKKDKQKRLAQKRAEKEAPKEKKAKQPAAKTKKAQAKRNSLPALEAAQEENSSRILRHSLETPQPAAANPDVYEFDAELEASRPPSSLRARRQTLKTRDSQATPQASTSTAQPKEEPPNNPTPAPVVPAPPIPITAQFDEDKELFLDIFPGSEYCMQITPQKPGEAVQNCVSVKMVKKEICTNKNKKLIERSPSLFDRFWNCISTELHSELDSLLASEARFRNNAPKACTIKTGLSPANRPTVEPIPSTSRHTGEPIPSTSKHTGEPIPSTSKHTGEPIPSTSKHTGEPIPSTSKHTGEPIPSTSKHTGEPIPSTSKHTGEPIPSTSKHTGEPIPSTSKHTGEPMPSTRSQVGSIPTSAHTVNSIKIENEGTSTESSSNYLDQKSGTVLDAPTFYPTAEEFQDPIKYYDKIAPHASAYGLCKIVPPRGFTPPCTMSDAIRFAVIYQYISKMYNRWGPVSRELAAIKAHLRTQSVVFARSPLLDGSEVNLPKLYYAVERNGGLSKVIQRKRWGRVADEMKLTKLQHPERKLDPIYMRYLLPYATLSDQERQKIMAEVESCWTTKYQKMLDRARNPFQRQNRMLGAECESESDDDNEDGNVAGALKEAEDCIVQGRIMNLATFKKIATSLMDAHFEPTKQPSAVDVEKAYWRAVLLGTEHIVANTASIDTGEEGYGFSKDPETDYGTHPWNLKVLARNPNNVLRYLGAALGVTIPTLHLGMLFSTSCWHRDPHGLPWTEYMHSGADKIWYGIPRDESSNFRRAVETLCPAYCQNKSIWLASEITMVPPNILSEHGVKLSRLLQKPGEYVFVFPEAHSCSITTGFAISESVYFASNTWLSSVYKLFQELRNSCEPTMFSLEQLLLNGSQEPEAPQHVGSVLSTLLGSELEHRRALEARGLKVQERPATDTPLNTSYFRAWNARDQDECEYCRSTLYLSKVIGLTGRNSALCPEHAIRLLEAKKYKNVAMETLEFVSSHSTAALEEMLERLESRSGTDSSSESQEPAREVIDLTSPVPK